MTIYIYIYIPYSLYNPNIYPILAPGKSPYPQPAPLQRGTGLHPLFGIMEKKMETTIIGMAPPLRGGGWGGGKK